MEQMPRGRGCTYFVFLLSFLFSLYLLEKSAARLYRDPVNYLHLYLYFVFKFSSFIFLSLVEGADAHNMGSGTRLYRTLSTIGILIGACHWKYPQQGQWCMNRLDAKSLSMYLWKRQIPLSYTIQCQFLFQFSWSGLIRRGGVSSAVYWCGKVDEDRQGVVTVLLYRTVNVHCRRW